ncbi:MAG: DNA polymerase IV [Coriobacteriia bacterium]|nr:DNA polymerase IV [Coriobacteriia bacterium]
MASLDYDTPDASDRPWGGRAILHLDIDAFFASVAQLDNPKLRDRPVIVGSPGMRGVVSTCSYEARRFGVRSAMSSVQAKRLCPDAIWVPGDFARYHELSDAVFDILRAYSPVVLPVSIDEAFCDVTPNPVNRSHPVDVANLIQKQVAELGITCSIGLSSSMTVSKIGSDYQKPRGLTVIYPGEEEAFLAPLPIRILSGIGAATAQRLDDIGVHTLGDLAQLGDQDACMLLGSVGITMRDRACGIDERSVAPTDVVKSVSNENTFLEDLSEKDDVMRELGHIAEKVARRLRKKELAGKTVSLKVRTSDFDTHGSSITVPYPVDDLAQMIPLIEELLPKVWHVGHPVRLLGVGVSNFISGSEQLSLLEENDRIEDLDGKRELSRNIDAIREKFGTDAIRRGL